MLLRRAKTQNGNYLVFRIDERSSPIGRAVYATPEGLFLTNAKNDTALAERTWAQDHWEHGYEEEEIPHEGYNNFMNLFSDQTRLRCFGPESAKYVDGRDKTRTGKHVPNTPFASLRDMIEKAGVGDNH